MMRGRARSIFILPLGVLIILGIVGSEAMATPFSQVLVMPKIETFISKWKHSGGSELGSSQSFLNDFCALLEVPLPEALRAEYGENSYSFEYPVRLHLPDGKISTGRIDLYKRGCFVW